MTKLTLIYSRSFLQKLVQKFLYRTGVQLIMAKWGEGDPRWIVEERPDAANVNNWHWYVYMFYYFLTKMLSVIFTLPMYHNVEHNVQVSNNGLLVMLISCLKLKQKFPITEVNSGSVMLVTSLLYLMASHFLTFLFVSLH